MATAARSADLLGVGTVSIRPATEDHPAPRSASIWDDWGDLDPEAGVVGHEHWVIDLTDPAGTTVAVGSLSAHPVWHGPTTGSRALNIGISLVEEHRGRGLGSVAQRLLAEELHDRGVVRVEASTDVANIAEQRALERAGFQCEGVLRGAQVRRDGRHDLQLWSHLRDGGRPMGRVTVRPAALADVPLLDEWDTRPHVIAASGEDDNRDWAAELTADDPWVDLLIAEEDGRPVGVLEIIHPDRESTHYWGDIGPGLRAIDIWIGEESDLGRGLGSRMMGLALAHCFRDPEVTAVIIDPLEANLRARRFYERLGFAEVGPRRFGADDCVVYRLSRQRWQQVTPGTP